MGNALQKMVNQPNDDVDLNLVLGPVSGYSVLFEDLTNVSHSLAVDGDKVFVPVNYEGLRVYDVSDPLNVELVGNYTYNGNMGSIAIQGDFLYINDVYDNFLCLNVSDVTNITYADSITNYDQQGFALGDGYAYLSVSDVGLAVIDITDPYNMTQLTIEYDEDIKARDHLIYQDNFLYTVDYKYGLYIYDVSNPFYITRISRTDCEDDCLAVMGDSVYVIIEKEGPHQWEEKFLVRLDISNPYFPRVKNALLSGDMYVESPRDLFIENNILYFVDFVKGIYLFDITTPAQIERVGYSNLHRMHTIRANNNFIYTVGYDEFTILSPDSDSDLLPDLLELSFGTDLFDPDCDDDWLLDGEEYLYSTDPFVKDTDGDGFKDGKEVHKWKTSPIDSTDKPGFWDLLGGFELFDLVIALCFSVAFGAVEIIIVSVIRYRKKKREKEEHLENRIIDEPIKPRSKIKNVILGPAWSATFLITMLIYTFVPVTFGPGIYFDSISFSLYDCYFESITESGVSEDIRSSLTSIYPNFWVISFFILASLGLLVVAIMVDSSNLLKIRNQKESHEIDIPKYRVIMPKLLLMVCGVFGIIGTSLFINFAESVNGLIVRSTFPYNYEYFNYNPTVFISYALFLSEIICGIVLLINYKKANWVVLNEPPKTLEEIRFEFSGYNELESIVELEDDHEKESLSSDKDEVYDRLGVNEFPNYDKFISGDIKALLIVSVILCFPIGLPFYLFIYKMWKEIRELMVIKDLDTLRHYAVNIGNIKCLMAAVALGDIGTPEDIPILGHLLKKPTNLMYTKRISVALITLKKRHRLWKD